MSRISDCPPHPFPLISKVKRSFGTEEYKVSVTLVWIGGSVERERRERGVRVEGVKRERGEVRTRNDRKTNPVQR